MQVHSIIARADAAQIPQMAAPQWPFCSARPQRTRRKLDDLARYFGYGFDNERNECRIVGRAGTVIRRGTTAEMITWLAARRDSELRRRQ